MKDIRTKKILALCAVMVSLLFVCSCRKKPDKRFEIECLRDLKKEVSRFMESHISHAFSRAIRSWENYGESDGKPIIIYAMITRPVNDGKNFTLNFLVSDTDYDLCGIIVHEHIIDSNGRKLVLSERYPVCLLGGMTVPVGVQGNFFKATKRESGERIDEKAWNEYAYSEAYADMEMPAIYLTVPERGKYLVYIQAYDMKGNLSRHMPLRNYLDVDLLNGVPYEEYTPEDIDSSQSGIFKH